MFAPQASVLLEYIRCVITHDLKLQNVCIYFYVSIYLFRVGPIGDRRRPPEGPISFEDVDHVATPMRLELRDVLIYLQAIVDIAFGGSVAVLAPQIVICP